MKLLLSVLVVLACPVQEAWAQVAGAIAVYPQTSNLEVTSTQQFVAYVPISPNTIVWSVNGVAGGSATLGTITASGLYAPPALIPANNTLAITATSTAFPSSSGSASLTVTRPYPWLWSASPSSFPVGQYKTSFNGANFARDSQALANGVAVPTTYVSSTKLTVNGTAAQPGTIQFSVRQPGPGAVTGNKVNATVAAVAVGVSVAPSTVGVSLGATQAFAATVTGSANTAVTWTVNGLAGGSAAIGTVTPAGVYTAPSTMPAPSVVTLRATSTASASAFGQASVTLLAPMTVTVSPQTASVGLGTTWTFAATVTGNANTSVAWSVNGINGGSATVGTISSAGVYKAPAVTPAANVVTVRATSSVSTSAFSQASVTLVPPVTVAVSPASTALQLGNTQNFTAAVSGAPNGAVTWSVNGTVGGSSAVGTIDAAGLYTAPAVLPAANVVTVRATSVASASAFGQVTVTLSPAPPPATSLTAARFLEEASFGPTPATLARVQQIGIDAYLDEQFAMPETVIPVPSNNGMSELRSWMLYNYTAAPDQLRQRVAYALSQIVVTSAQKLVYADEMLPWLQLLSQHAFGNYRDLLHDVSISPSMGKYLDLANSMKPGPTGGANENYPRELMQLFTIGLWELNQDGSQVIGANNAPVPTYDQATVGQLARALTGWTYATAPGATPKANNWEFFGAPMEARPANHDVSGKVFLGCTASSGQSVQADLDSVLDCLMQHHNIAPFIATRLIRSLVTSNPSPGYVQRVADVFAAKQGGAPGDLKAVVRAILKDPEARQDNAAPTAGRLKEPILQTAGLLRALNGQFSSTQGLTYLYDYMGQSVLAPNSVFSWFSPLYRAPGKPLFGPEFQIYSPTEATLRGNLFYLLLSGPSTDSTIDLSPFQAYGNDMPNLVEAVNQVLLYGRMSAGMKQALIAAATPGYDATTRIMTVLYLAALSGQYAVQY